MSRLVEQLKHTSIKRGLFGALCGVDRIALCVALAITVATSFFLPYVFTDINKKVLFCKLLQFFGIYYSIAALRSLLEKRKDDKKLNFALRAFVVFSLIETLLLLAVYPGEWRADEMKILNAVLNGEWFTWQNYLSAVFYMVCLETLPAPAFILLVQGGVISVILAFIVFRVRELTGFNGALLLVVVCCILLLPPVMNMNLYPLRAALHSFLEVLVFFLLLDHFVSKRVWTYRQIVNLALLGSLVCVWRTECFVFLVLFPFLLFLLSRFDSLRMKKALFFTAALLLLTGCVGFYQNNYGSKDYSQTAYISCIVDYAHEAKVEGEEDYLAQLDEIYNLDELENAYQEAQGGRTLLYGLWSSRWMDESDEWENGNYYDLSRQAFIDGTLKYPDLFFSGKIGLFLDYYRKSMWPPYVPVSTTDGSNKVIAGDYHFSDPISVGLRDMAVAYMGQRDANSPLKFTYNLFLLVPVYLGALVFAIVKRSRLFFLLLAFLAHPMLVLFSAPVGYWMYYYDFYLGGILIVAFAICWLASKFGKRSQKT